MAMFNRGDIVLVSLDPTIGNEQQGLRPALVLSDRAFNQLGDVLVAPITQGGNFSRFAGFAVTLSGSGCKTQGVILVNKVRMMDLTARQAKKIESVPDVVLNDVINRLLAIVEG
jgi:mRNA interferase ChpB